MHPWEKGKVSLCWKGSNDTLSQTTGLSLGTSLSGWLQNKEEIPPVNLILTNIPIAYSVIWNYCTEHGSDSAVLILKNAKQ